MANLAITSLRGGMNNTDPSISLQDDQCVLAENVEFIDSMLGERRLGTDAIDLPAFISSKDRVTFLFRHLPTSDETSSELWALGVTGTASASLGRKTSTWQAEVTLSDAPTLTGFSQYRWAAASSHGKLFIAYDSSVDRLHVWDGTSLRRSGLAEPAAPSVADTGAGSYSGIRYFRVRYTVQSGGSTIIRSEPSEATPFTPSGTGAAARISKPAAISEGETHWEVEASTDNANFYRIATLAVGTGTYDDATVYATGYSSGTLSEDTGDYTLLHSARYLLQDDDRLILGSSWEDEELGSRVTWTPVFGASGDGNDERQELDTDPFVDLDTGEHGSITAMSGPVLGAIWVFKQHAIYKLIRSGHRAEAYNAIKYTEAFGAVHGSATQGVDGQGFPCIYFLDHEVGPCMIGRDGLMRCGEDLRKTWEALNSDATQVVCSSLYYPRKKQVYWNIAVDANNTPTKRLVLNIINSRPFADGVRKGWSLWSGNIAKALTMCLYSDNIDDNTARSNYLVPFMGLEGLGLVHRCETGNTDNGVAYAATITTRPYFMKTLLQKFKIRAAALLAKAAVSAAIDIKVIRDFGLETTKEVTNISMAPTASETEVIVGIDNLKGAELTVAQIQFEDVASPLAKWELNRLDVQEETGQKV